VNGTGRRESLESLKETFGSLKEHGMFIASAFLEDDKQLLVLGLSRGNRARLEAGQPIDLSRASHGMAIPANLKIMIFAGETEQSMRAQMDALIGPTTVIDQKQPT
jgi:hypothetical protein